MQRKNWNKEKINLPLGYDDHIGVAYSIESGQVCVGDILNELAERGITEDVYELLDASPCEERYGMIRPGWDSIIRLVVMEPAWGVVFGWNNTSDLWSVIQLKPGDGIHTLIRMKDGGLGSIHSFHTTEKQAIKRMRKMVLDAAGGTNKH